MTNEELMAKVAQLEAENAVLKNTEKEIVFKVSGKGAVSVYGLGRFPVTLYKEQWEKLLAKKDELLQFITNQHAQLAVKR